MRLGGAGLGVGDCWFVAVVSSVEVVVALDDDEGEGEGVDVVPMRKRKVWGIVA